MLFALYITDMGKDLFMATQGVTLHRVCVSALFFAVRCICAVLICSFVFV